jgi:hypothetical protein
MITLYGFHKYILSYHNILDFWSAKNVVSQSISYDYGLIIFTKMFNWVILCDNSVMPLLQRNFFWKDFENHKLRHTMKYGFFKKNPLFIWINNSIFHFFNVNLWYNYLQLIKFRSKKDCLVLLYEVQYNLFFYNVKWTFILTLVWTSHLSKSPSPYCAFTLL